MSAATHVSNNTNGAISSAPLTVHPYLHYQVYNTTRARILSTLNKFYYKGSKLHGLGSPHTSQM